MRTRTALYFSVLALAAIPAPAGMGAEPQASLYAQAETVWQPDGGVTLTHGQGGTVTAGNGTIGLRGSFGALRSLALAGEAGEGTALEGTLDIEAAAGPDTVLRGGFALRLEEETRTLTIPGQPAITALSPTLELAGSLGLRQRFGNTVLDIELGQISQRPGESTFPRAPLPPERLAANTDLLRGAFSIEHALSPALLILARAEADRLSVSPADTLLYGRLPTERLRLSAGFMARPQEGVQGELRLGAELLSSPALPGERFVRPYGYGAIGMVLRQGFSVTLSAEAGTAFEDAADGFADWHWRLGAEAEMLLTSRLALAAGLHVGGGEAVLASMALAREVGAEAGLTFRIAEGLTLGTRLGLARETDMAEVPSDALTLSVSVRAEI